MFKYYTHIHTLIHDTGLFVPERKLRVKNLFDSVYPIISKLYDVTILEDFVLMEILLYGNTSLNFNDNRRILRATIFFILNSKRFVDD